VGTYGSHSGAGNSHTDLYLRTGRGKRKESLDSFARKDVNLAIQVCKEDEEIVLRHSLTKSKTRVYL